MSGFLSGYLYGSDKTKAAAELGISLKTIYNRLSREKTKKNRTHIA